MKSSSAHTTPKFSIITACLPARSQHLSETAASIDIARKAIGPRRLEWILVIDGPGDVGTVNADTRIQLPRRCGISAARNIALASATGELVVPLDADDLIEPTGLYGADEALQSGGIDWIAGNRLLLGSGAKTPHWHGQRNWGPGQLSENWTAPLPFHPNSIVARAAAIRACGGWPGLPVNEDLLIALLLSERSAGASIPEVLTHYRVWPEQEVSDRNYSTFKAMAFSAIEDIINEVRKGHHRSPITRPAPGSAYGIQPENETR